MAGRQGQPGATARRGPPLTAHLAGAVVTPPTFCYVVLCHRLPDQVVRLAARIRELSPAASVVIRHDRGPAFLDTAQLARVVGSRVSVLDDSHPVTWGSFSMVEATERAFARAREAFDPDWLVLVSGQDWPVRDLAAWEAGVVASGADAVVRSDPVDLTWSTGRRISEDDLFRARWTHRWRDLPPAPLLTRVPAPLRRRVTGRFSAGLMWYQRPVMLRQLPRGLGWKLGVRRRDSVLPAGWTIRKGEQWLACDRAAVAELERLRVEVPSVRAFFAGTHIPDESYLHTVLGNTASLRVLDGRVSWHRFDGSSPSPAVLTDADVGPALASGAPFARKLDTGFGPGWVDAVDRSVDAGAGGVQR